MRTRSMASKVQFALVAGLLAVAAGSSGCRFFKKKDTSAVKSTAPSTRLDETQITYDTQAAAVTTLTDTSELVVPFVVNDARITKSLGNLSLSVSNDDSSLFSNLVGGYEVTMKVVKNGVDVVAAQPVKNGEWAISAEANIELNNGDKIEVVFSKIPPSFVGFNVIMHWAVQLDDAGTTTNELTSGSAYWSSTSARIATAASVDLGGSFTLPRDSLWEMSVHANPWNISSNWIVKEDNAAPDCGQAGPLAGTLKVDFSRPESTSPRKTVKELQDLKLGELMSADTANSHSKWSGTNCGIANSLSLEAAADSMSLAGQISNLQPGTQFVSVATAVNTNFGNAEQLPLANATMLPGAVNGYDSKEFAGKIENTSFKVTVRGTKKEGLSIASFMSFSFPVNSPAANVGPDEWKKVKIVGKGMGLDASGKPVDVPLTLAWGDRSSLSFEETKFIHLAQGGQEYDLEVTFPDSMKGVYVSLSLTANKLFDFIETMSPRPGSPASSTREAYRNHIFAAFQTKAEGYAANSATFKPMSQWYAPTGEPPDYKSADKAMAKQMDVARVLAGMEAVRNTFHLVTEEGIRKGDLIQVVDRGTIESCLENTAPHWSDITLHYYCTHSALRSCYTGGIRATAGFVQAAAQAATDASTGAVDPGKFACSAPAMDIGGGKTVPVVPGLIRAYVWQKCSAPETDGLSDLTPPATLLPGAPGGVGCPAGLPQVPAYVPTPEDRTVFSWITASKDRAQLFRYMMDAPTFGFNDQDQQDVINAFWRVRNPADKEECNAKRPRRAIDPTDGTHCLANKVYSETMEPTKEGR